MCPSVARLAATHTLEIRVIANLGEPDRTGHYR